MELRSAWVEVNHPAADELVGRCVAGMLIVIKHTLQRLGRRLILLSLGAPTARRLLSTNGNKGAIR